MADNVNASPVALVNRAATAGGVVREWGGNVPDPPTTTTALTLLTQKGGGRASPHPVLLDRYAIPTNTHTHTHERNPPICARSLCTLAL